MNLTVAQARMFIRAAQAGEVDDLDLICLIDDPEAWMTESSTDVAREMFYRGVTDGQP